MWGNEEASPPHPKDFDTMLTMSSVAHESVVHSGAGGGRGTSWPKALEAMLKVLLY